MEHSTASPMMSQSSQALSRFLGPYECLERLGVGGMGSVYKARNRHTRQLVAVKVASRRVLNEPILLQRFEYEYEAARHLQHPQLVRALEHGVANGAPYLVMEYVPGKSLDKWIIEKRRLSLRDVTWVVEQIGGVLEYLHQHSIIHRDIKPGNILVSDTGDVKLADLGLVKNLTAGRHMTRSATGLGTMEFSAPEQFEDARNADARADIYSLAATAYLALTGEYPFGRGGQIKVLRRKMCDDVVPPTKLAPYLPGYMDQVLLDGMRAESTKRPASVREFVGRFKAPPAAPASTEQPATTVLPSERRTAPRVAVRIDASCRLVSRSDVTHDATIQDVSPNGICLRSKRRFEVGSMLRVELDNSLGVSEFVAKVRWVKSFEPNVYLMGCFFTTALAPAELEALCYQAIPKTNVIEPAASR
jgi:serine/threonine protein kinase